MQAFVGLLAGVRKGESSTNLHLQTCVDEQTTPQFQSCGAA